MNDIVLQKPGIPNILPVEDVMLPDAVINEPTLNVVIAVFVPNFDVCPYSIMCPCESMYPPSVKLPYILDFEHAM